MRRPAHHLALALATLALACGASASNAATSSTVVGVTVPNATSLGMTGCPSSTSGITELGTVLPGASMVTSANCVVGWGSSNNSSMLRAYQSDGTGTAMNTASLAWSMRTTPDNAYNFDVAAYDNQIAYIASGSPGVRATSNGGSSWTTVSLGGGNATEVAVAPGTSGTAIATTSGGAIYRTTSTGSTWSAETSGTAAALRDVSMADATNAFAVGDGGVVRVRTTAGGSTWVAGTSIGASPLKGVSAVSTSVVFAVATDGTIARSGNGASTWSTASGFGSLVSVAALDANNAIAVAYGGSVVLINWNGTTLTGSSLSTNIDVGEDLRSVWVVPSTTTVYAAGVRGTLMKSTNSGTNWTRVRPGNANEFDGVAAPSDGSIWLAGGSGTVVRSANGTTFATVREASTDSGTNNDILALSASSAVTVGSQVDRGGTWQASIRTTTDGGATWTSRTSNTTEALFSISAGTPNELVAVGDDGTVARSTDAGVTWSASSVIAGGIRLWGVDMVDEFTGWAVGDGGTILQTRNGGVSWTQQASPVTTGLRSVSAVDELTAFAVGTRGRILRTLDGGATWVSLTGTGSTQALDDVSAVDATTVYVAYGYQTFLTSTNASAGTPTWTSRGTSSGQDSLSVDAVSRSTLFITDAWGYVTRSIDGGATWATVSVSGGNSFPYAIDALDEDTAWESGSENTVLRTLPPGTTDIGDYADAGPNWGGGGSMFGACLMGTTGAGVTPVWNVDGVCGSSGTGIWRGIPASEAVGAAKIAGSSGPVAATASLRFGMRVPTNQAPGRYSAGINFEVVAPDA